MQTNKLWIQIHELVTHVVWWLLLPAVDQVWLLLLSRFILRGGSDCDGVTVSSILNREDVLSVSTCSQLNVLNTLYAE